jgi:hypothetical protein
LKSVAHRGQQHFARGQFGKSINARGINHFAIQVATFDVECFAR